MQIFIRVYNYRQDHRNIIKTFLTKTKNKKDMTLEKKPTTLKGWLKLYPDARKITATIVNKWRTV